MKSRVIRITKFRFTNLATNVTLWAGHKVIKPSYPADSNFKADRFLRQSKAQDRTQKYVWSCCCAFTGEGNVYCSYEFGQGCRHGPAWKWRGRGWGFRRTKSGAIDHPPPTATHFHPLPPITTILPHSSSPHRQELLKKALPESNGKHGAPLLFSHTIASPLQRKRNETRIPLTDTHKDYKIMTSSSSSHPIPSNEKQYLTLLCVLSFQQVSYRQHCHSKYDSLTISECAAIFHYSRCFTYGNLALNTKSCWCSFVNDHPFFNQKLHVFFPTMFIFLFFEDEA